MIRLKLLNLDLGTEELDYKFHPNAWSVISIHQHTRFKEEPFMKNLFAVGTDDLALDHRNNVYIYQLIQNVISTTEFSI